MRMCGSPEMLSVDWLRSKQFRPLLAGISYADTFAPAIAWSMSSPDALQRGIVAISEKSQVYPNVGWRWDEHFEILPGSRNLARAGQVSDVNLKTDQYARRPPDTPILLVDETG